MPPKPAAAPHNRPPQLRGRLSAVTGGYDIHRWPISVPLLAGESLPSWLIAVSARYALSPAALFEQVGAPLASRGPTRVAAHAAAACGLLASVMGWDPQALAPAVSAPEDSARVAYLRTYHHRVPAPTGGSRFCPGCLADTGGRWQRGWGNPLQVACPQHRVLLRTRCPHCGRVPFSGSSWFGRVREGWRCPEHTPTRDDPGQAPDPGDDTDLRSAPTGAVASPDLLAAQQLLNELAEQAAASPNAARWVCGVQATAAIAIDAVLELIDEAVGYRATMLGVHHDPAVTGAALTAAGQVLAQNTVAQAAVVAEPHGLLDPAGAHTPITVCCRRGPRVRNPLLAAIRLGSLSTRLPPASQLLFRTAADWPRYPTTDGTNPGPRHRLPTHAGLPEPRPGWIPQLLWPGLLTEFTVAEDPVDTAAGLAMALAKLGSTRSWALIALDLGLPSALAARLPMYWRRVIGAGRWPALLTGLETLCQQLQQQPPPIDYQARRIIADNPRVLARAVTTARRHLPAPTAVSVPPASLMRRFWELYTGGDVRHAPAPTGLADPARYQAFTEHRPRMTNQHHQQMFATAFQLLNRTDAVDGGPLTWSPTTGRGVGAEARDSPHLPADVSPPGERCPAELDQQLFIRTVLAAAATPFFDRRLRRWVIGYLDDTFGIPTEYAETNVWIDGICDLTPRVRHGHPLPAADTTDPSVSRPLRRRLTHTLGPGRRHGTPAPWHPTTFLDQ